MNQRKKEDQSTDYTVERTRTERFSFLLKWKKRRKNAKQLTKTTTKKEKMKERKEIDMSDSYSKHTNI
jgi:hypothetical protein